MHGLCTCVILLFSSVAYKAADVPPGEALLVGPARRMFPALRPPRECLLLTLFLPPSLKLPPFRAHLALRRLCAVPLHEHVGSAFLFRSCCHSLSLQPCRLRVSPRSSFHPLLTLFPSEVLKRSSGASSRTRPLPGLMVPSRSLHPQVFSDRRPISQLVWPPSAPLFPYHVLSSPRCSSFPGLLPKPLPNPPHLKLLPPVYPKQS